MINICLDYNNVKTSIFISITEQLNIGIENKVYAILFVVQGNMYENILNLCF